LAAARIRRDRLSRGRCVDAYRAFNGSDGTQNAYTKGLLTKHPCCYPSGKGQQLMAQLLRKTGLAPCDRG
jgi:hypothetical protein